MEVHYAHSTAQPAPADPTPTTPAVQPTAPVPAAGQDRPPPQLPQPPSPPRAPLPPRPSPRRRVPAPILRDALGIAVPTGAFGLSFGALAVASGFTTLQTCALSLLMFTGGSQFALVSALAAGGAAPAAGAAAVLLGGRNALYGLRVSALLRGAGPLRRALAAHFVIDESAAMAAAQDEQPAARAAFWATGLAIFILWNLGTLLGALAGSVLPGPAALGLNAAAPAAFLALLAPRLTPPGGRDARAAALAAVIVVLALVPYTPVGVPVVAAALVAVAVGMRIRPGPHPPRHTDRPSAGR